MKYKLLEPPSWFTSFDHMNLKQAKEHLKWYIEKSVNRIQLLKEYFVSEGGGNESELNYSEESLKIIWRWFIQNIKIEKKSQKDFEEEVKKLPKWVIGSLGSDKLDVETTGIAMDIGIYFAEVFIRNNSNVKWGLAKSRSKSYINYNRPVLLGFVVGKYETEIDPSRLLYSLALKVAFDNDKEADLLYKTYIDCKKNLRY